MNIPSVFWLVPVASVVALAMAYVFFLQMMKADEGTPRMKEIALFVRKGAMAYLWQQYKVVLIVFAVLCVLFAFMAFGLNVQNRWPFAFLTGGFFSGLAGFFGMKTATYASARTANAARESLDAGLKIAFRSGAVMGLTVVGLGLLDIAIWSVVLNRFDPDAPISITTTMLTFGMGALHRLSLRVSVEVYTQRQLMSGLTSWERLRLTYLRTTRVILLPSQIMLETTLATWLVWVLTCTRATAAVCCRQLHSVRQLSLLVPLTGCR